MKFYKSIWSLALLTFIVVILFPKPSLASDDCAFILNTKCTVCHNLGRVCRKLGKKNKSRWESTITRMVGHGAALSNAEQKELTTCLFEQTDNVRTSCK